MTGTVITNRLPADLKLNKTLKYPRKWNAETLYHIGMNIMTPEWKKGPVCRKDRDIVYCH